METSRLQALSESEIQAIHGAALQVLERTGVIVDSSPVRDRLRAGGCRLEEALVRIPPRVVEGCLRSLPPRIAVCDREGEPAFLLGDGTARCASGHNAVFVLAGDRGERRAGSVRDVEQFAIVSDHLSEVDVVGVPVTPQDAPPEAALLQAILALLRCTRKPVYFSTESRQVNQTAIELAKELLGVQDLAEKCSLISQLSPTSPLHWEQGAAEAVADCAQAGLPQVILPAPIGGATSPHTLAGLLTLQAAELLSGVVIAQLARPGAAVVYGTAWLTFDMRTNNALVGRPEASLLRIASAQLAAHFRLPSHTTAPESDANLLDEQMAWEKMLSTAAALAAGTDLIMNLGMFGAGMTVCLEQLVIDAELCRIARRFCRGIQVNCETIAAEAIARVGPRGNYLMDEHTVAHLRTGEHVPLELANSVAFGVWQGAGGASAVDNARRRLREILELGNRSPLERALAGRLEAIVAKRARELAAAR